MNIDIILVTYNQEKYLADALQGFVLQKTSFPFVAVVIDDCSTDGTAEVLRHYETKYPDVIKAVYLSENYYSQGKSKQPFLEPYDSQSQYIALCEGDDYWIDPLKLQKQVDILDADSSLMGVFTNRCKVDAEGNVLEDRRVDNRYKEGRVSLRDFFNLKLIYPTASVLYRNTFRKERAQKYQHLQNAFLGDWTWWIVLHCFGDFYYLDDVTSAYRINPTSVTHTQWIEHHIEHVKLDFDLLPRVADILPEQYADLAAQLRDTRHVWAKVAKAYYKDKCYLRMLATMFICIFKCPKDLFALFRQKMKTTN